MTIIDVSICLGAAAVLAFIFSPILFGRSGYQRQEELLGRPVTIRTTQRF